MKQILTLAVAMLLMSCQDTPPKERYESGEKKGDYVYPQPRIELLETQEINGYKYHLIRVDDHLVFGRHETLVVLDSISE